MEFMKRVIVCGSDGQPIPNATVVRYDIAGVYKTDATGGVNIGNGAADDLCIKVQGIPNYQTTIFSPLVPSGDSNLCIGTPIGGPNDVELGNLKPNFPNAPTRDEVCGVNITFQGLTVITKQYGVLPWFEAALAWLSQTDRMSVYAAKHSAGDSHCIIQLPFGPLYNESGQPYAAFPNLDWTNNNTSINPAFVLLVEEVIENGFRPIIFPNENQPDSLLQMQMVIKALQSSSAGDLTKYCLLMTGWDGVFYGWSPEDIVSWSQTMRSLAPNCYLGIEHNFGHIPLGGGVDDYGLNGRMSNFDVIFGEFSGWLPDQEPGDFEWQILGRMIRPYNRPPEQPADDDPNPPFYLSQPSYRGPYYYCAFEFDEYRWVRGQVTADEINQERAYFKQLGCKYVG